MEHLTAAWKDFAPPGFGGAAELGSTLKKLVLPEKALPYACVCLAHLLKPKLASFVGVWAQQATGLVYSNAL